MRRQRLGQRIPLHRRLGLAGGFAAADHREPGGDAPVGDRNAGIGRGGDRRGYARHDLKGNAVAGQGQGFLAAAPEHERVAALKPRHGKPGLRPRHQQGIDAILRQSLPPPRLARKNALGLRGGAVQQRRVRQAVVDDHVRPRQSIAAFDGDQPGVAGAGAD